MRANIAGLCLSLVFSAACMGQEAPVSSTQPVQAPNHPWSTSVYCSGFYTSQKVPDDLRLVSGEQSAYKISFASRDLVYLSKGTNQGVKEGDRFSVVRQEDDPNRVMWFKWQEKLTRAMGNHFSDLGQLEVINAQPNTAIAKVSMSCKMMQRGDIVLPFAERPVGPYKNDSAFDSFAPVSGKPVAMVVRGRDTQQMTGRWDTVFVNLGTSQGVKVGDYFRIFRYQGTHSDTMPIEKNYQDQLYGFGSNPKHYAWNDLPREVLGEGIVLNASQNSATVLVTVTRREIFSGDYVELE
ncbi:MAG TPA: hypothetical protein VIW23_14905 [Candidatus Acidoferrum sp.]|jgi:hypothetical protein